MSFPDYNEFVLYLLVGSFVTVMDVLLYAGLGLRFRLKRIQAHLGSTSCGIFLGFTLHSFLVFQPDEPLLAWRLAKYLVVIVVSVYGVQSLVIYILGELWRAPIQLVQAVGNSLELSGKYSDDFLDRMTGKVAAVLAGVAWNYVWFKWFVYA